MDEGGEIVAVVAVEKSGWGRRRGRYKDDWEHCGGGRAGRLSLHCPITWGVGVYLRVRSGVCVEGVNNGLGYWRSCVTLFYFERQNGDRLPES